MMIDKKQLKTLLRSYGHNYYKAAEFYLSDKEKNGQHYKELLDYNDERYIKWIEETLNNDKVDVKVAIDIINDVYFEKITIEEAMRKLTKK